MLDSMTENLKKVIYQHERKTEIGHSSLLEVINSILIDN